MQHVTRLADLFLSFHGRLSRKGFWMGFVILLIPGLATSFAYGQLLQAKSSEAALTAPFWLLGTSFLLFRLQMPLFVKRLHDRGSSGKAYGLWVLVAVLLSAAPPWIAPLIASGGVGLLITFMAVFMLWGLASIWFFVQAGFLGPRPTGQRFASAHQSSHVRGVAECAAAWVLGAGLALVSSPDAGIVAPRVSARLEVSVPAVDLSAGMDEENRRLLALELLQVEGVTEIASTLSGAGVTFELTLEQEAQADAVLRSSLNVLSSSADNELVLAPLPDRFGWHVFEGARIRMRPFVPGLSRTLLLGNPVRDDADAHDLVALLTRLPGIAWAGLEGGREPVLRIEVDEARCIAYGVNVDELQVTLKDALLVSGGDPMPDALHDVIVAGEGVRLGDIALVERAQDPSGRTLVHNPLGVIHVLLASGADWTAVANEMHDVVAQAGFDRNSPLLDESSPGPYLRMTGEAAPGTSVFEFMRGTQAWLDALVADAPKVSKSLLRYTGTEEGGGVGFDLFLRLEGDGTEELAAIEANLRDSAPPAVRVSSVFQGAPGASGLRRDLVLFGEDLESLAALEVPLIERAESTPGVRVIDVLSPRSDAQIISIEYDHERLDRLGMTVAEVSASVQRRVAQLGDPRRNLSDLGDIMVGSGIMVPLGSVASWKRIDGLSRIVHVHGRRALRLRLAADSAEALAGVETALRQMVAERDSSLSLEIGSL